MESDGSVVTVLIANGMPPQEKFSTSVNGDLSKGMSTDSLTAICRDSSSPDEPPPMTRSNSKRSVKRHIKKRHGMEQDNKPPKDMDFDELLPHVGEFGIYQRILFIMMIPFAFFVAFVYFSQIFITLVPEEHWCRVPELEHLTVEER